MHRMHFRFFSQFLDYLTSFSTACRHILVATQSTPSNKEGAWLRERMARRNPDSFLFFFVLNCITTREFFDQMSCGRNWHQPASQPAIVTNCNGPDLSHSRKGSFLRPLVDNLGNFYGPFARSIQKFNRVSLVARKLDHTRYETKCTRGVQ